MKQKRRKKRKGSNRGVTSICFIVLIRLVILSVQSQGLKEKLKVYAAQQEELQQKIDSETARTDEIKKLEEYKNTTEYVDCLLYTSPSLRSGILRQQFQASVRIHQEGSPSSSGISHIQLILFQYDKSFFIHRIPPTDLFPLFLCCLLYTSLYQQPGRRRHRGPCYL